MKLVSSNMFGKIRVFNVEISKETAKTYHINVDSLFGDKVVKKDELMKLKSGAFHGSYRVYCKDNDVSSAFSLVQNAIKSYCAERIKMLNKMLENCEEII